MKVKKNIIIVSYIIVSFCIIFSGAVVHATNWYVDNTASGFNKGTSWPDAWKSFSDVTWGGAGVVAGDTLYISGGSTSKTYTEYNIAVTVSGTSGNPVTIRAGQDEGHNGQVIFDYDAFGDSASAAAMGVGSEDYITINGEYNGSQNIIFKNLRHTTNRNTAMVIYGSGATNIKITYVQIINCNSGVWISSGTDNEVSYSDIQVRGEAAVRFAACTGSWDANLVHHNTIELLYNGAAPPGWTGAAYVGPDGITCGNGVSIYNNTVRVSRTTEYTSTQHPDMFVADGNYIKIYNNETINVGDSVLHFTRWANPNSHDYLIYNNVFRIEVDIDPYPEYFRLYTDPSHPMESITNLKILNNTFVDNSINGMAPIRFYAYNGNPTASGIEIKNNVFYNCGDGAAIIAIDDSTGFDTDSFTFANNVYYNSSGTQYIYYRGVSFTTTAWLTAGIETDPSILQPSFVSYTYQGLNNDLRLASGDTVATGTGENLSTYFVTDKIGNSRPQGGAWAKGAFEGFTQSQTILPVLDFKLIQ